MDMAGSAIIVSDSCKAVVVLTGSVSRLGCDGGAETFIVRYLKLEALR